MPTGTWFGSPKLSALVYTNEFTRDVIHKCEETSFGFPLEFSFKKNSKNKNSPSDFLSKN
jgi:hypothetical protein